MGDGPNPFPGGGGGPLNPGCTHAWEPQYSEGARKYHEDLCQPVAMLPTLRHPSQFPGTSDWKLGRFEPCSITPIRAVDFTPSAAGATKCRHHYGYVTMNKRGRMEPFHASEPIATTAGDETVDMRRNHRMLVCRLENDDPEGIIPKGRFFYRGSYQAPWWTDLEVQSLRVLCSTPN